jgi:hypothetical protein
MAEPWKPLPKEGRNDGLGVVDPSAMAVKDEDRKAREAAFDAKRAELLGADERLRTAARANDLALIKSWPAGDSAINKGGQGAWTALHFAAREGNTEVVQVLLEKNADPKQRTSKGEQALHCAAAAGKADTLRVLIGAEGADVNAPGPYKATPLHVATTPACAEILLEVIPCSLSSAG